MNKKEFKLKVFSLSEKLFPMVARILGNNIKAEDAIQDIMLKLWSKRREIKKHPNIEGFVFLTARNYCIDVLRKKLRIVDDSEPYLNVLSIDYRHSEIEWDELNAIVLTILKSIPEQQKDVFLMRDIDGYSFKEVAAALDITVEHTRVLLSRARKKISFELENTYSYEKGNY